MKTPAGDLLTRNIAGDGSVDSADAELIFNAVALRWVDVTTSGASTSMVWADSDAEYFAHVPIASPQVLELSWSVETTSVSGVTARAWVPAAVVDSVLVETGPINISVAEPDGERGRWWRKRY
jgi:hypothetical protein